MVKKTPLSQVYFVLSFLSLLLFSSLYLISSKRNYELSTSYSNLEKEGSRAFGTIKEFNLTETQGTKNFIYTYSVSDESGRLSEVVEYVDPIIHKKLRIGDSIIVVRKTIDLLGQKILISRIVGNKGRIPVNGMIEIFASFGMGVSLLMGLISFILYKKKV
jgi:hypothetical protein